MRRVLWALVLVMPVLVQADESWLGLYMQGKRIGYSHNVVGGAQIGGKAATRSDTHTVMVAGLLGAQMKLDMRSSTWVQNGKPVRMVFRVESAGRVQALDAVFGKKDISLTATNEGAKTSRVLAMPTDAPVVDDALNALMTSKAPQKEQSFYVLDPMMASLVLNTVSPKGTETVSVRGKMLSAHKITITEPRATTEVYLDDKGRVLKAVGPMGIEMLPITQREALAPSTTEAPDLADLSRIPCDKTIADSTGVRELQIRLTGSDLSRLPSDDHQTISKAGAAWSIVVHPVSLATVKDEPADEAAKDQRAWVNPSLHIPSDSPRFRALATKIAGEFKNVLAISRQVHDYVNGHMRFNAGIGVLRDASEVLSSGEGVCRDYAILTATLTRAAGIPTRLVSGIVYQDGFFYYHAWVQVLCDGKWIGVDSTRPFWQTGATHIELAVGNVDEAFSFTFLDKAKVEVMGIKR